MLRVPPTDEVLTEVASVKTGKKGYVFAKFDDVKNPKEVILDLVEAEKKPLEDIVKALPADSARYIVFNFDYEIKDGKRCKTILVTWIPDKCKIKEKMVMASNEGCVKGKVNPNVSMQARGIDDLDRDAVIEKCTKFEK